MRLQARLRPAGVKNIHTSRHLGNFMHVLYTLDILNLAQYSCVLVPYVIYRRAAFRAGLLAEQSHGRIAAITHRRELR